MNDFYRMLCVLALWGLSLTASAQASRPVFPLQASPNGRYFVDTQGKPFLYHADTGWQLYHKLTTEEAVRYLAARKAQGFTTIQTQLATTPQDVDRYGNRPFGGDNDFSRPGEAYHNHVAEIIAKADSLGLLIVMSAPWLDCCRGGYGMSPEKPYQQNGPAKSRQYGQYLGNKFKGFNNLLWIMGGDNDPGADREAIEQLALGLYETAPQQLMCYHAATTHSSTDLFQYAPWLGFSMVYTYYRGKGPLWLPPDQVPEVYQVCLKEYNKSDKMPFILGEAQYEGSAGNDKGTPDAVRRQAYWTLLSGGTGHAYGSEVYSFPAGWGDKLDNPGARQMGYLVRLFGSLPWHELVPDQWHRVITKGYGDYGKLNYVTTAVTEDKKLCVSYVITGQTLSADLGQLAAETVAATWFDPRTGKTTAAGTFAAKGQRAFAPPGPGDWLLLLDGRQ